MDNSKLEIFIKQLNPKHTRLKELLSEHTTLGIGGPADIFYEAHDINELVSVVKLAKLQKIPVTILGRGSNVLISDKGIRGIVIKNLAKNIQIKGEKPVNEDKIDVPNVTSRWESDHDMGTFKYEFKDLNYDESDEGRVEVIMDSGVDLTFAINYLLNEAVTGLQWFAGIPGTIGGAVFNNIHGGTRFLSEVTEKVKVLTQESEIAEIGIKELGVDYDKSRFHESGEIILQATFNLFKGDVDRAKATAQEWARRKSLQPRNTPGCAFANISQEEREKFGYPTTATGYVVEHVLNMSGYRIGDAAISKKHHNFIENEGKATAKEYIAVMREIQKRAKEKLDIHLEPEIFFLGFKKEEIADLYNN